MKILFLYMFPLYGNGSASFLRELTKELIKHGHSVAIVAPDKRRLDGVKHYVASPPQNGVFIGHPELKNAKKFQDMNGKEMGHILSSYLKTSIDAVADFNPDIIHAFHTAFLPSVARTLKLLFGMRIIITTHGSDLTYLAQDRRLNGLIRDANRVAVQITANSEFTKKAYLQMFGEALAKKTQVIHGGVRLENYTSDQKDIDTIDAKYKLKGKKVVLFTGRLIKEKGVKYLINAAPYIKGTLVIVGDGPERRKIEEQIKRKKLTNVLLAGYINSSDKRHLHAFYERADIYVAPSIWEEGFGLTILEAMAAHTPVVASSQGGIVSIIKDQVNGLLIPPRSGKAIAEAVNLLLNNDELRKKYGEEAYKTVVENFTWEKIAEQYEVMYKKYAFSTSEYLQDVQGDDPKASQILRLLDRFLTRNNGNNTH